MQMMMREDVALHCIAGVCHEHRYICFGVRSISQVETALIGPAILTVNGNQQQTYRPQ